MGLKDKLKIRIAGVVIETPYFNKEHINMEYHMKYLQYHNLWKNCCHKCCCTCCVGYAYCCFKCGCIANGTWELFMLLPLIFCQGGSRKEVDTEYDYTRNYFAQGIANTKIKDAAEDDMVGPRELFWLLRSKKFQELIKAEKKCETY